MAELEAAREEGPAEEQEEGPGEGPGVAQEEELAVAQEEEPVVGPAVAREEGQEVELREGLVVTPAERQVGHQAAHDLHHRQRQDCIRQRTTCCSPFLFLSHIRRRSSGGVTLVGHCRRSKRCNEGCACLCQQRRRLRQAREVRLQAR